MRERPTILLLHGGPGFDHSIYKPRFGALTDVAQVVYLDLRGNGRSDASSPEHWNLAQWADDVAAFCDELGVVSPVIYGASFGGMVALSLATRHPQLPGKLVLVSTECVGYSFLERRVELFEALGGPVVGDLARRRFVEGDTSPETLEQWVRLALPLYTQSPMSPDVISRGVRTPEVTEYFTKPGGEQRSFDFSAELGKISCPVLVMSGALDPMIPLESQEALVSGIRPELVRQVVFPNAGHGVVADAFDEAMDLIREFVTMA